MYLANQNKLPKPAAAPGADTARWRLHFEYTLESEQEAQTHAAVCHTRQTAGEDRQGRPAGAATDNDRGAEPLRRRRERDHPLHRVDGVLLDRHVREGDGPADRARASSDPAQGRGRRPAGREGRRHAGAGRPLGLPRAPALQAAVRGAGTAQPRGRRDRERKGRDNRRHPDVPEAVLAAWVLWRHRRTGTLWRACDPGTGDAAAPAAVWAGADATEPALAYLMPFAARMYPRWSELRHHTQGARRP